MAIDPRWRETDFYEVLGVDPGATTAEIARAYRRLARSLHPDTNADPDAAERFNAVTAAYEVLGDPDERAAYDRVRRRARPGTRRRPGGGYSIRVEHRDRGDDVSLRDRRRSTRPSTGQQRARSPRRGAAARAELTLPFAEAVQGTTARVTDPERPTVHVRVPAGVEEGQTIRVPGRGEPGSGGGPAGDLLITVHVEPHELFGRAGDHLTLTVPVSYTEAVLGAEVRVPTIDGDAVTVTVPPGSAPGAVLRVPGRGAPTARGQGRGDLLVSVALDVPRTLGERQRELIAELGAHDRPDLRSHLDAHLDG